MPDQNVNEYAVFFTRKEAPGFNHKLSNSRASFNAIMPYQLKKTQAGYSRNRPICTYCGMSGHTVDKCYKKHGYPPGYKITFNKNYVSSTNQVDSGSINHGEKNGKSK